MSKIIRNIKSKINRKERGQVLVIVALAAVGIIAIIGLAMDVGLVFIGNARLRRAVDSAALSAALQFREGYNQGVLTDAANELLVTNGFSNPTSLVSTCDFNTTADMNCTAGQARKLVRVHATANIKLAFLPVIGINDVLISATAISETASLDVVLAIDRSESMTYGDSVSGLHPAGDPMRDPYYCNGFAIDPNTGQPYLGRYTDPNGYGHQSSCSPFRAVITAAIQFTKILFFPYDEMSIVTFDKDAGVIDPHTGNRIPNLELDQDCPHGASGCTPADAVIPALEGLTVFQGGEAAGNLDGALSVYSGSGSAAPARCYDNQWICNSAKNDVCRDTPVWTSPSNYKGLEGVGQDPCPSVNNPPPNPPTSPADPSPYTTTNIGGGLEMAGNELATDSRQDVLWVVILLTDGVPNAGHTDNNTKYYCPQSTWSNLYFGYPNFPWCDNGNAAQDWNNGINITGVARTRPVATDSNYDALAYAFDQADFVGLPFNAANPAESGQDALIYTIGLGSELNNYQLSSFHYTGFNYPAAGATVSNVGLGTVFLNYAAGVGHGLYYPAPNADQLQTIFRSIGSDIAVRLAK